MRRWFSLALVSTVVATVAEAQAPAASPCDLLTAAEIEAAAGWKPAAPKAESYGTTATCTFTGSAQERQVVVLTLAKPAPKVASSQAFADRRIEYGKRNPELATPVKPVDGLGVPAIRTDDGSGPATIEAVTGGRLLGVTAPTMEAAEALAKKAIPRVR